MMQKKQSLDLDELLGNSPAWPPFNQSNGDDDREPGAGEWVDKLMVNKQDRVENPSVYWDPNNANISHIFNQKYLSDSYTEKPCSLSPANNHFVNTIDDLDELDARTSDSSEDLLWQFNHSKLGGFSNGIGQKVEKPHPKQTKSPEIR